MPIYEYQCMFCGVIREHLSTGDAPQLYCCGANMQKIPSCFSFKTPGGFVPQNDVELDDFLKTQGSAPVFKSEEHRDKANWAVKKARMGDLDLKI